MNIKSIIWTTLQVHALHSLKLFIRQFHWQNEKSKTKRAQLIKPQLWKRPLVLKVSQACACCLPALPAWAGSTTPTGFESAELTAPGNWGKPGAVNCGCWKFCSGKETAGTGGAINPAPGPDSKPRLAPILGCSFPSGVALAPVAISGRQGLLGCLISALTRKKSISFLENVFNTSVFLPNLQPPSVTRWLRWRLLRTTKEIWRQFRAIRLVNDNVNLFVVYSHWFIQDLSYFRRYILLASHWST